MIVQGVQIPYMRFSHRRQQPLHGKVSAGKRTGIAQCIRSTVLWVRIPPSRPYDSVAQLVEQRTFNPWVGSSSLLRVTSTRVIPELTGYDRKG